MERRGAQSIGDVLTLFIRENGMEQHFLEKEAVRLWPEVMGPTVARLTRSVEMDRGTLRVRISSAALRSQLFDCRHQLIARINEAAGRNIIQDIRLL